MLIFPYNSTVQLGTSVELGLSQLIGQARSCICSQLMHWLRARMASWLTIVWLSGKTIVVRELHIFHHSAGYPGLFSWWFQGSNGGSTQDLLRPRLRRTQHHLHHTDMVRASLKATRVGRQTLPLNGKTCKIAGDVDTGRA